MPGYIDRFQGLRRDYARIRARYPELGPFDEEVAKLADRVGGTFGRRLVDLPQRTAQLLFDLLTVQALTTLLVLRRDRMLQVAFLALVAPARRDKTEQVFIKIWRADRGIPAGEGDRHGDRRRPDVPGARSRSACRSPCRSP